MFMETDRVYICRSLKYPRFIQVCQNIGDFFPPWIYFYWLLSKNIEQEQENDQSLNLKGSLTMIVEISQKSF